MKKLFTLAAAVLASFSLWANQTDLISGVTLPDVPASSLDMATQTFKTADENGWIVMEPNGDIRNASVTWFTAMAWNTTSVTISDVSSYTAPFVTLNSVSCTTVRKTERTKAIRFTGATDASFLASSTNNKYNFHVALYSIDGTTQTLIEDKSTGNAYTELYFSDLNTANDYVAYFYADANNNAVIAEIALKKFVNTTSPVAEVTIDGPAIGVINKAASYAVATDVKADAYQWYVNDVAANEAVSKTFEFTPTATGNYSIVCKARNANNATDEWIASDAIVLKVYSIPCGEIIKATLTSGTAATVTGTIGGTADVSLSSSKKMDNNKYFGITLADGTFQEGDTVVITMTTAGSNYPCLFGDKDRNTLLYLATEGSSTLEYKIVLPEAANTLSTIYLSRNDDANYKWNPVLASMAVIRPMPVKSTSEELTAVKVNDQAIDANQLATLKASPYVLALSESFVNAPVITFTKHVTTIYEDDSQVERDVEIQVTAAEVSGAWSASATINAIEYTISASKESSFTVHYMDGETELGTENVAAGGTVADYAQYQHKNYATFISWFIDVDLSIPALLETPISSETYLYAKFENKYAASINIEKAVMENGKGYAIMNQLGTLGYASSITGSLDSLDVKDDGLRNYAYLGLKVKQNGALLNFLVEAGKTVKIKFGEIKKTPNVSINGGEYAAMEITNQVYTHTAEADEIISIKMMDGNAVVFQQIMIGEELQAPELFAINCAEAEHGTIAAPFKLGIPGEVIALTVTPAEGYKIVSVSFNEVSLEPAENVYSFIMPAAEANVEAVFGTATAIDNTNAEMKAVKRVINGQLFIEKGGVLYNLQGAVVK